jgi:hypothetical protein
MNSRPAAPNAEILKQVQIAFSEHLREGGGKRRHWPLRLRRLAASAVDYGHGPSAVGKSVGVSGSAVVNWSRKEGVWPRKSHPLVTPPVELKVVKCRKPVEIPVPAATPATVRILFRGGAILECEVALLTSELVAALNGGAQ